MAPVLVVVPVGDGRALLDRAEPVRPPRLEEHRLDERGLPHPAVSDDGDVPDLPVLGRWHQARVLLGWRSGPWYRRTATRPRPSGGLARERAAAGRAGEAGLQAQDRLGVELRDARL